MTILVLDFSKQNFLHLSNDYTRLLSTKDATGKVWIRLSDLHEVVTLWLCASFAELYDHKEQTWNTASPFLNLHEKSHASFPS